MSFWLYRKSGVLLGSLGKYNAIPLQWIFKRSPLLNRPPVKEYITSFLAKCTCNSYVTKYATCLVMLVSARIPTRCNVLKYYLSFLSERNRRGEIDPHRKDLRSSKDEKWETSHAKTYTNRYPFGDPVWTAVVISSGKRTRLGANSRGYPFRKNTQLFERLRLSAQTKKLTIQPLDCCCNSFTKTIQPYKWLRVSAFRRAGIIHSEWTLFSCPIGYICSKLLQLRYPTSKEPLKPLHASYSPTTYVLLTNPSPLYDNYWRTLRTRRTERQTRSSLQDQMLRLSGHLYRWDRQKLERKTDWTQTSDKKWWPQQ